MIFHVLSLFPGMLRAALGESIMGKAQQAGRLELDLVDIREFAEGRHRVCDDYPYGGGPGMVMKPEPIAAALDSVKRPPGTPVILLTPQGETFRQETAEELSRFPELVLLCGRYEGVDERVRESMVTRELSIGDFVLTGGEYAAMVVIDAVARLLPGVLGDEGSTSEESFSAGLLEYPQYTRPPLFRGMEVPGVLLSGDHGRVRRWRRERSLERTLRRRPELLAGAALDDEDRAFLEGLGHTEDEREDRSARREGAVEEPSAGKGLFEKKECGK